MRYKVACNHCGKAFVAEAETTGTMKYRCPHCGRVVSCKLGEEKTASLVNSVVEKGRLLRSAADKSSTAIGDFRKKHKNGDLWLFFGFSLLFVVVVMAGLYLSAEMWKLIASGRSWLFRLYLDVVHAL